MSAGDLSMLLVAADSLFDLRPAHASEIANTAMITTKAQRLEPV
jgi:hypothetical protein